MNRRSLNPHVARSDPGGLHARSPVSGKKLPPLRNGSLPRWQAAELLVAVDSQRVPRTHMATSDTGGKRLWRPLQRSVTPQRRQGRDVPWVMGLLAWLGTPASDFVIHVGRKSCQSSGHSIPTGYRHIPIVMVVVDDPPEQIAERGALDAKTSSFAVRLVRSSTRPALGNWDEAGDSPGCSG